MENKVQLVCLSECTLIGSNKTKRFKKNGMKIEGMVDKKPDNNKPDDEPFPSYKKKFELEENRMEIRLAALDNFIEKIFKKGYSFNNIRRDAKPWRIPDDIPPNPITIRAEPGPALQSLDSVFIDDALKDDIVTRTALPDLLEGTEPAYTGVILFGPPGTGKTVLLRAIAEVYQACGAYAQEVSVAEANSAYVGEFARNLERQFKIALKEAQERGRPSFLYFDEGSILAQKATEGSESMSKHYQEAIDVMKRYIGNERNLVVAISTNLLLESFEAALTREGRLTSYFIGYPDAEQRKRMWKHFALESKLIDLTDEQAYQLAEVTPAEQGAFIEEFTRNYKRTRRTAILRAGGYTTLVDALKKGANVPEIAILRSITFGNLYADLAATLTAKYERLKDTEAEKGHKPIGFKSG